MLRKVLSVVLVVCMAVPWTVLGEMDTLTSLQEDAAKDRISTHELNVHKTSIPFGNVTLSEAYEIAREAYIFFQPVVDQYQLKDQYGFLPTNKMFAFTIPPNPTIARLTTPYQSPDQYYSIAFLDLRKEPIVVYNPKVHSDRMYSIMVVDHFEHNFAYFGSRTTSNDEANYMIAGPDWDGSIPTAINASATSESNFVTLIVRMKVDVESRIDRFKVSRLLWTGFSLMALSVFNGENETDPLPDPDFPPYEADQQERAGFFNYVDAYVAYAEIYPDEQDLYNRFARIGIIPGEPFPPEDMSPTVVEAIEQGIWEGSNAINSEMLRPKGANYQGWNYVVRPPASGNRQDMNQRYLARAATARSTFEWGNSIQESTYMQTFTDSKGNALDGANNYTLHWTADQIPKVNPLGFWAITMYDTEGYYVEHEANRYAIGTQSDLDYGPDGSVTIYIQNQSPGKDKESNWLPCPEGTFQLFMRIYWPSDEMISENYADYIPPGAEKIRK